MLDSRADSNNMSSSQPMAASGGSSAGAGQQAPAMDDFEDEIPF